MLFNSFNFLIFFVVVTIAYFVTPHRLRWLLLLVSSCYFYMTFVPVYILILAFTIIVDYYAGIIIENTQGKRRKALFLIGLFANILVLAFFKYYNFLNENLTAFLGVFQTKNPIPYLHIILPIGLSFHTFQAMSYIIEINRGRTKAERHLGIFAVYVMFYPQLVAGPIERAQGFLPQFREKHYFEYDKFTEGLKLMIWGLFKKVVIADRLAIYVNAVYNNQEFHNGTTLIVATFMFSFQIYCDFSGYSDIAIGAAKVMGFRLTNNFNTPYLSKSIAEFWSKWHISLSNWLRDYIYLPIIHSTIHSFKKPKYFIFKKEVLIYSIATIVTFLTSGIWHGAAWTYVMLGVVHGFYLVFAINTKSFRYKISQIMGITKIPWLYNVLQIILTFMLVNFGYIFFRANSFSDALSIIKKITFTHGPIYYHENDPSLIIYSLAGILFLIITDVWKEHYKGNFSLVNHQNWAIRSFSYVLLVIVILIAGVFDGGQFIYFQF